MEKLDRPTMLAALEALNARLAEQGIAGELCIYGGATMVLAFNARLSTHDLDAVFEPPEAIRQAAAQVGEELRLREGWLNDGVKGWVSDKAEFTDANLPQFSNLRLSRPGKKYLLAMKCLAARSAGFDLQGDKDDIVFLIRSLQLKSAEDVIRIVEEFYPAARILPKTRFMVEEIMSEMA